jgi:hypothetical protein
VLELSLDSSHHFFGKLFVWNSQVQVSGQLWLGTFFNGAVWHGRQDGGPQLPTDVTMLVKAGSNVLQVIGEFPGEFSM